MKYELAIVCGRFQPLHLGHQYIINKALDCAETVGLYIGSCNNTGTMQNPFTFEERLKYITVVYKNEIKSGRLIVKPLNDREHPADDLSWGKYYLDCIHRDFGEPDLFVYGNDKVRTQWFTKEDLRGIDELVINRNAINVSGTIMREYILHNNKLHFMTYCDHHLHKYFSEMREKLMRIQQATSSK